MIEELPQAGWWSLAGAGWVDQLSIKAKDTTWFLSIRETEKSTSYSWCLTSAASPPVGWQGGKKRGRREIIGSTSINYPESKCSKATENLSS